MHDADPGAVIAGDAPAFSEDEAIALVREHYGLDVTVRPLISERDQNFRLRAADGRQYVLKIANRAEEPVVTDFQVKALRHVASVVRATGLAVTAPEVVLAASGADRVLVAAGRHAHVARVITYLPGVPLGERVASPALARDMGNFLAGLGRALRDFEHPGESHDLLWDMQQALALRPLAHHVRDADVAAAVDAALDDFERHAWPHFADLRRQVIHNDFNADNVLVREDDENRVAGIIDFGDMLRAPLVVDVAIGASYLRPAAGDPLALIAEFVGAYHRVTPLEAGEIDILFELVQARLCASVVILEWRAALRGDDDPYLLKFGGESIASRFLCRLRAVSRDRARQRLRQACAPAATGTG